MEVLLKFAVSWTGFETELCISPATSNFVVFRLDSSIRFSTLCGSFKKSASLADELESICNVPVTAMNTPVSEDDLGLASL